MKNRRCDIGRYYSGDIDGKFWFGVQSSDAADRFGVTGSAPSELYYYFYESDLEGVEQELKIIELSYGDYFKKLDEFFGSKSYYTDNELIQYLNVDKKLFSVIMKEYADYILGMKIKDCLVENGSCEFTAEC